MLGLSTGLSAVLVLSCAYANDWKLQWKVIYSHSNCFMISTILHKQPSPRRYLLRLILCWILKKNIFRQYSITKECTFYCRHNKSDQHFCWEVIFHGNSSIETYSKVQPCNSFSHWSFLYNKTGVIDIWSQHSCLNSYLLNTFKQKTKAVITLEFLFLLIHTFWGQEINEGKMKPLDVVFIRVDTIPWGLTDANEFILNMTHKKNKNVVLVLFPSWRRTRIATSIDHKGKANLY